MMGNSVILVVGSLHHDILIEAETLPRRDETAVGRRWYPKFGGKGGNQALAASRAGAGVRMLGAVGADDFGRFLLQGLDRAGVDRSWVRVLDGVGSGMSVAIQDARGDYAAAIVSGANLQIDPAELLRADLWAGVRLLILQNEVAEALNRSAAQAARQRGVMVVLNAAPALRPGLDLSDTVDVLVVNAVEAEMMGAGAVHDLDGAQAAARVLAARYPAAVVTAGARGLAGVGADGRAFRLAAEPVPVVSSHGAGDCFTGSLAAALVAGQPLEPACRIAARAAARHVSSPVLSPT